MNDFQLESLLLYKPESSFANIFPDFPKTINFFMFLKFWSRYFQVRQLLLSDCFLFFYKVFTINGNILYYESHFASQFIPKSFSVMVGFHNLKVKTRSFLFIIMGMKPLFSNFALQGNS